MTKQTNNSNNSMKKRFDGYLPVIIDVETGGVDPSKHPLLELAAVLVQFDENKKMLIQKTFSCHIEVPENARLDPKALEITGIDPYHPFRLAIPEEKALEQLFQLIQQALQETQCRRAILVGHNAHFDLSFIQAACKRAKIKENPFHRFTVFDTATLAGLAFGKTVLAKALKVANIKFDKDKAHSALYDAQVTAELFCKIINNFPCLNEKTA